MMTILRAKKRYEIDGKTVLHIPDSWATEEQMRAILNKEQVTFSADNENSGEGHGRKMGRSIMRVVKHKQAPDGIYVTVELDIQALPVSRRELDGNKY
jgi:hypothetical protein